MGPECRNSKNRRSARRGFVGRWTERVFLFVGVVGILAVAGIYVASHRLTWRDGYWCGEAYLYISFSRTPEPETRYFGTPATDVLEWPLFTSKNLRRIAHFEFRDGEFKGDYSEIRSHISWLPKGDFRSRVFHVTTENSPMGTHVWMNCDIWVLSVPFVANVIVPIGFIIRWRLLRRRWRQSGCCESCGYSLSGNASGVCPECGVEFVQLSGR